MIKMEQLEEQTDALVENLNHICFQQQATFSVLEERMSNMLIIKMELLTILPLFHFVAVLWFGRLALMVVFCHTVVVLC
jgi:hypothetical protein